MSATGVGSAGDDRGYDLAIVGETNLDLILYGLPVAMPVERELLASGFVSTLGGSSSILAHNLSVLGSRVRFHSVVGGDELGRLALERLARAGVGLGDIARREDGATGVTLLLPHGRERHILTYAGVMAEMTAKDLPVGEIARTCRHVHVSSFYLQRALQPEVAGLFRELRAAGLTTSLDTNDDPEDAWAGLDHVLPVTDVLLPNEDELLRMTRSATLEEALRRLGERVPLVVVKRGARGALVQERGRRTEVAARTVVPVDTIGAGDSFNAGFLHAWLRGADAVAAAELGCQTGALSTQRAGGTEAFLEAGMVRSLGLERWG